MELNAIEQVYPQFVVQYRKDKGYSSVDGIFLIKLWYEYLKTKEIKE
jgi:hypothetical protein